MREYLIGEVFEFVRNGASIKQADGKGGYPITRIETIWNQTIDEERFGYANIFNDSLNGYEKYLMQNGDILMTHINSPKHLGKCAMYEGKPEKLIHGMNLLCLRANQELSVPKYLKYYFNSMHFKIQLPKIANQSVNQASFSAGNLKKIKIPLPPLDQQKQIANILDTADAYRHKTKILIDKYDELTQSLFLDMFGDPVTNNKGLNKITLGELGKWQSGGTPSRSNPKYYLGDIPWLSSGELNQKYTNDSEEHINETAIKESNTKLIEKGSILLGMYDTAALKSTINIEEVTCNQAIAYCKLDEKRVNTSFVYHIIQLGKEHYRRLQRGVRQKNLNLTMVKAIDILLPPLELQNQFAELVKAIEAQKALAEQELVKADELFNSLLQKAFKGEL